MRFAVGQNGTVVNIIEVEPGNSILKDDDFDFVASDTLNAGDAYDVKDIKLGRLQTDKLQAVLLQIAFRLHNRVRVLEGQPQNTLPQFIAFVKSQL